MKNIFLAELYKIMRRPYMYIIIGSLSSLIIISQLFLSIFSHYNKNTLITSWATQRFNFLFLFSFLLYFIFHDDYKYGTYKNLSMVNKPKLSIFLGKLSAQVIAILALEIISLVTFFLGLFFFKSAGLNYYNLIGGLILRVIIITPLLLAVISIVNFAVFLTKNEYIVFICYFIVTSCINEIITFFARTFCGDLIVLKNFTLQTQITTMQNYFITRHDIINDITAGLITMIFFNILAYLCYIKKI